MAKKNTDQVKKNEDQVKWFTPTELSKIFLTEFNLASAYNLAATIERAPFDEALEKRTAKYLSDYDSKLITTDSKVFADMVKTLHFAITHQDTPKAQAFLNSIKFLSQLRVFAEVGGTAVHAQSFISQLDKFVTDDSVKCGLLLKMSKQLFRCGSPTDKMLIDLLTKNAEHVSTADWEKLISTLYSGWIQDINLVWTLVEQMEISLAKEIQEELQKVPYDIQVLEKLSANITDVTRQISKAIHGRHDQRQIEERLRSIQKKYQLENIISKEIEQIGELPKTSYAQAIELEQEKQRLQQQIAQLESEKRALEQQIQGKDQDIQRKTQELQEANSTIASLRQNVSDLEKRNSGLATQFTASKEKLKRLAAAASSMQVGPLASRSAKDVRDMATLIAREEAQDQH